MFRCILNCVRKVLPAAGYIFLAGAAAALGFLIVSTGGLGAFIALGGAAIGEAVGIAVGASLGATAIGTLLGCLGKCIFS
ncbi:MAG: hypothetical protein KDJ77_00485 [Rhodobiaceae bacterium]|nr:hypothetical protein [Rhodobiaceae bacterium]